MADEPASNPTNNDVTTKRKRRILRPATDTSTLREKSEKAQAQSSKPRRGSGTVRILATPFRLLGRPFLALGSFLGKFKVFRVIGYILLPPYIRNSFRELRLVTWPGRLQTRRLTFAVIIFSLIFGGIVAGVDYGLDKAFRALILNN